MLKELTGSVELEAKRRAKTGWDRRAKVELLQQLIDFVANNGQPVVRCVPGKVVAGSEPNKTNELLQALGRVARQRQQLAAGPPPAPGRTTARTTNGNQPRPRTFTKRPTEPEQVARGSIEISPPDSHRAAAASGEPPKSERLVAKQRAPSRDATFVLEPNASAQSDTFRPSLSAANPSPTSFEQDPKPAVQIAKARLRALRSVMLDIEQLEGSLADTLLPTLKRETF